MPPKYVAPDIALKAFSCPVCGALADQDWFNLVPKQITSGDRTPRVITAAILENFREQVPADFDERQQHNTAVKYGEKFVTKKIFVDTAPWNGNERELVNLYLSRCRSCEELSVWHHDTVLYPATPYDIEPNSDMNDDIKVDFLEARSILDFSPRGAAALLRLCIQKLCKQLGQPGDNINDDIKNLVKSGLDTRVQKILDVVRVIGNESVHPGTIDLRDDRGTAQKLFELVNRIAYDTITHKREVEALYDSLPKTKRDAIEKRDSK